MQKSTVLLFFSLLFLQNRLFSQEETAATELSQVVIRENRLELPFSDQSRTIAVLTRAQLDAMPVRNIAEALLGVTGVDVRQRGPFGVQADLQVRGGGFDQALVLVNGIRLSDPQTGHHLLNVPVDWNAIERIEVLKGPGARIYGQNAFACAVNIVTRTSERRSAKAGLAAGDFGYGRVEAAVSLPVGKYRQTASFSTDFSGGYRHNTDFKVANGFYQSAWEDRKGGTWNLTGGYTGRKFGANGFYGRLEFKDQYEEVQTSVAGLDYRKKVGNWLIKPRISWRRNQDHYIFLRQDPRVFQNFHLSQVLMAEFNAQWNNKWGQTGIGASTDYTYLFSTRLGERKRTTTNLFVEHRFLLLQNRLDITPGIAVSNFSDFGFFAYPGLDAGLRLNDRLKVYANAGYNYRIPTFTDLYYEDAGSKGNPDLQPESAFSLEGGVKYAASGVLLQGSVFRRDGQNLIDWAKNDEKEKWTTRNYNAVTMQGFDVSAELYGPALWGEKAFIRRFNAGYTFLDARVSDEVAFSRYALNHLRHQFTAGLEHRLFGPLRHSFRLRWCDRTAADATAKGDYLVADAKVFAQFKKLNTFVEASNLFNADYGEFRYSNTAVLTLPGRWFRGGVTYQFDF
jgi:vitamin B12 transporter